MNDYEVRILGESGWCIVYAAEDVSDAAAKHVAQTDMSCLVQCVLVEVRRRQYHPVAVCAVHIERRVKSQVVPHFYSLAKDWVSGRQDQKEALQ